MKRLLRALLTALLALAVVVASRAATFRSHQVRVSPADRVNVDVDGVARRLAGGIRFETISHQDESLFPAAEFIGFSRYLEEQYPRVHASLERETVSGHSLLYRWQGSSPERKAVVLTAHQDVVPVDADSDWTQPAFEGVIDEGFVWGRGAIDDKAGLFCILDAVESLLAEGFRPERTTYLAFGHDEEVGGYRGAGAIASLLTAREVPVEYVVDEGGVIAQNFMPGMERPIAVVGIAEKGSVSIGLSVEVEGGHSSQPPRETAIGILARAVDRLERNPLPSGLRGTSALFIDRLGRELAWPFRVVLANLWLLRAPVEMAMSRMPALDAMLRTTTAATIFEAGVKENVLPGRAAAVVNFRIIPGDSVDGVVEHVRRTIDDERISLEVGPRSKPREPSPQSPVDSEAFERLQRTIRALEPDVAVVPYLLISGSDARHYEVVSDNLYRFNPFVMDRSDLKRPHGVDERISLENLVRGVRFFRLLIQNSGVSPAG